MGAGGPIALLRWLCVICGLRQKSCECTRPALDLTGAGRVQHWEQCQQPGGISAVMVWCWQACMLMKVSLSQGRRVGH
jgi:hypothetical protein